MAFTAGTAWRRQGWGDSNPVTETLASLWVFFQPLLFSLIGAEVSPCLAARCLQVEVASLQPQTMALGLLVLLCGLTARGAASFLAVGGGANTPRCSPLPGHPLPQGEAVCGPGLAAQGHSTGDQP